MKCPLCHVQKYTFLLNPRRGGSIYLCQQCMNAYTYPKPHVLYEDHPFYEGAKRSTEIFRSYARNILTFVSSVKKTPGKLLDIGTGGGFLLEEAISDGWQAEGVDASKSAVVYCTSRGLRVTHGYIESASFVPKSFDVIVASHVVEHVSDANLFLEHVRSLLKKDGILVLCQTNYTGTIPRWYGRFWENWLPNEHIIHFSPQGIKYWLSSHKWRVKNMQILPLGYYFLWKWGGISQTATNCYYTLSYVVSKYKIGFPFSGDQMYVAASPES